MLYDKDEIKQTIEKRQIYNLYHFTHIDNLSSIIKDGFLSRKLLEQRKIEYKFSDEHRLDNRLNHISVSVSVPNNKMLYRLYQRNKNLCKNYIILALDVELLLEKYDSMLIYEKNAASSNVQPVDTFDKMFGDSKNEKPYDIQAEILIEEGFSSKYIIGIHYNNREIEKQIEEFWNREDNNILLLSHSDAELWKLIE